MSDNKYSVGDMVKLNAGGPDMSVYTVSRDSSTDEFKGTYRCQWFAGRKLESGVFEEECLVEVSSDDS